MRSTDKALRFLAAAGLLLAAGCGEAGGATDEEEIDVPEEAKYGGTAVVGVIGDVPDISPLTSTDHVANQLQLYVLFTPLLHYDENFSPVPYAAESWEVSPDTTSITFKLRDDLYWHDGVKTTAYDWKFSYDRARHPETGFANTAFWTHYGEATVVDSFTLRVEMEPHAEFLDPWRAFAAAPRHVLKDVAPAELRKHPFATRAPLGNGPFRFVSHQDQQSWTFEAYEDFPEEMGGRPYLDRLVLRIIPEPTTLLTELLTGSIDFYMAPPAEQADQIEAADGVRLLSYPNRQFVSIIWNSRRELFEDARVRRALTMGIDREAIIRGVLFGYGSVANTSVPPFFWQAAEDVGEDLRYDPDEARRLLAEAGWVDRDRDGVLENEEGREFRFQILSNKGNDTRADVMEVAQSDLKKIGVVAEPRVLEWGTLLDMINNPDRREFDAVLIGWVTEFRIDDTDLFHCDKVDEPYQWAGYCNPETDRLLDTLPKIPSRDASLPLWHEYQRKISADQPYTFLYYQDRLQGVSNRLRNVDPDARGDFVGVADWWLLPGARRGAT